MPTPTARLGLLKPTTSDQFVTQDLANNWQKVDDTPGYRICSSSSRPVWNQAHAGMLIVETDTGLIWRWTGTAWMRTSAGGVLRTTTGALAIATRTTDFSTSTASALVLVLAINNVVVPDGNRPLMVALTVGKGENSNGAFLGHIVRSATANSGPTLGQMSIVGDSSSPSAGSQGASFTYIGWEPAGLAPGTYSYSFQIRSSGTYGGTSYIRADANIITRLVVVEL